MTHRVVITPAAERDLDAAFLFIARDDPAASVNFVNGVRARIGTLKLMPRRCPRAPEDGQDALEIRHLIHGRYRIIFTIDGDALE